MMSSPGHAGNGHSGNGPAATAERQAAGSEQAAAGGRRRDRRHGARVVRLLHLRHGRRARVRRPLLLRRRPRRRHADRLRDVRRRLRRPPLRRHHLRSSRRPHRAPRDADHHDVADGPLDRAHRPAAHLLVDRDLGADPARAAARAAGPRRGRGVRRRLDAAGRARSQGAPRLLLLVRPDRRADRPRARHPVVPARRAAAGRSAQRLGLAHPVPARLRDDRRRAVGAPARRGVAGLPAGAGVLEGGQAADRRRDQELPAQRARGHRRARLRHGGRLHVRDLHGRLCRRPPRHDARGRARGGGDLRHPRDRAAAVLRQALGPHRATAAQPLRRDLHGPVGVPVLRAGADGRAGARVGRADRRRDRRLGADDRRPARVLRRAVRGARALHRLRHLA